MTTDTVQSAANLPPKVRASRVEEFAFTTTSRARWAGLTLVLAALVLYVFTLDNGLFPEELVGGDLITHQYAQVQARPSNAPGYPLYTMGGWLWFHALRAIAHAAGIHYPNPIPLLSSYSTLWALLALWLLYRILCRITQSPTQPAGNWPLAWLLSAFYAVTYFFWYYATTTEQYSSAIAQTLAIVYFYLEWRSAASADPMQTNVVTRRRWSPEQLLILLALLCGLALAHMLTVAFIVPPLVAVILWQAPRLLARPRLVLATLLAAFLPLVSYLYVYARGAAHPEWWGAGAWATPQAWFWAFVSTAQGRDELSRGFGAACAFFDNGFPELIWQELSLPIVLLGIGGIARLDRRLATLLFGTLGIYGLFCWAYRCGNWFQVILPAYPLLLLGVAALINELGQGAAAAQRALGNCTPFRGDRHLPSAGHLEPVVQIQVPPKGKRLNAVLPYLFGLALVLTAVWRFEKSLPRADSRNRAEDTALDQAALLLAQPLPQGAPLFAAVDDALALQYLTAIWQVRPDLQVVSSGEAAQWLARGVAVYSTWPAAPTLAAELPPPVATVQQAVNPQWIQFQPAPFTLPATATAPWLQHDEQVLTPAVTLAAYGVHHVAPSPLASYRPTIAAAADDVTLLLVWRLAKGTWPAGLSISVRPLQGGQLIAAGDGHLQQDRSQPAQGLYHLPPAPNLADESDVPGEAVLLDPYQFRLATDRTFDGVQVLLYRQQDGSFINVAELQLPVALAE
ncbi:MAG: DUF2723 domain-containing protein [Caldilineaceae bacterium]